jgi:hypothetical protein
MRSPTFDVGELWTTASLRELIQRSHPRSLGRQLLEVVELDEEEEVLKHQQLGQRPNLLL